MTVIKCRKVHIRVRFMGSGKKLVAKTCLTQQQKSMESHYFNRKKQCHHNVTKAFCGILKLSGVLDDMRKEEKNHTLLKIMVLQKVLQVIFGSTKNIQLFKEPSPYLFIVWRTFFTTKNLLWNRKVLQMLKDKKVFLWHCEAPLFLRV